MVMVVGARLAGTEPGLLGGLAGVGALALQGRAKEGQSYISVFGLLWLFIAIHCGEHD
jgi:hypothetical protein